MKASKHSMLGAEYPDTPSNITTAAIINNRLDDKPITPEKIKGMGVEDLVALNAEIFSISLVVTAFINGELDNIALPKDQALSAASALKLICNNANLPDEEFLATFEKAVHIWPQIIELDYDYTNNAVRTARRQAKEQEQNPEMAEITASMVKNHVIDALSASELMTSMVHYAHGINRTAEKTFEREL